MMFCSIFSTVIPTDSNSENLMEPVSIKYSNSADQNYRFYFDELTQDDINSGNFPNADGKITTKEPSNGQSEVSIIETPAEFVTPYLLSDINISGVSNEIDFNVFYQFSGPDGATAEMDVILMTDTGAIMSEQTEELDNPCNGFGWQTDGCGDPDDEKIVFEGVNTFLVESDGYLKVKLEIVSTNNCDSGGGFGGGDSCDVKIFFGDISNDNQETYLNVRTNTLSGSSFKVHKEGAGWNDVETLDWYPHDSDEDRSIQISVDIRSAFGRADISEIELFIDDADGVEGISEFTHVFSNNDLIRDNEGFVGNVVYDYQKGGLKAGTYPLELRVTDLQHDVPVVFTHDPLISHTYGIDFELSDDQGETLLVAPGQTSRLEFSLTHIGYADNEISVELSIQPPLTSDWQVEFDQPVGGYQLDYGGTNIKPTLLIKAPDEDMSTTPPTINLIAVPKVNGSQVTDVSQILLDIEQIDVYSDPRLSLFEDAEHQNQIGDSVDDDFDVNASNFVDYEGIGEFYLDIRNTGFDVDQFRMKFLEIPDQWDAAFVDNNTGEDIMKDQGAYPTGDVNSNVFETILVEVYPPVDREAPDIGIITLEVTSANDLTLRATISFTVQRTFGVHSTVVYDCDASPMGYVNIELSTCENPAYNDETFRLKITSTASESDTQITTFQLKNPSLLDKTILTPDGEFVSQKDYYGTWDFEIYDSNSSLTSNVKLSSGDSAEVKVLITPSMGMLSGDHTIYLRIVEEVEADSGIEPKYFDMPLTIFVGEDEPEIEITQISANELIGINSFEEIEMRVYNVANVEALVLLKLESSIGDNWKVTLESEDGGELLTVAPFSEKNFTIRIDSPSCMRHNEVYDFEITAKPLDINEAYGDEYTTTKTVRIQTNVESIPCRIQSELFSEPDPVTIGVLGSVVLMFVFWFSRRGMGGSEIEYIDEELPLGDEPIASISEEGAPIDVVEEGPEPVLYEEVELVDED